jgi:hypothetical protein
MLAPLSRATRLGLDAGGWLLDVSCDFVCRARESVGVVTPDHNSPVALLLSFARTIMRGVWIVVPVPASSVVNCRLQIDHLFCI